MLTIPTFTAIRDEAVAFFRTAFPGKGVGKRNFLGKISRALSMLLLGLYRQIDAVSKDAVPSDATSTTGLDDWAETIGLPSNAGGYGRNAATLSSGGTGNCTGTPGTVINANSQLTAEDGVTVVELTAAVTIPGGGSIQGNFAAITPGTVGNLAAGSVLTWMTPPAGADATVTLISPLTGALDAETNTALLARIYDRWQRPPKGGAAADYSGWVEAASALVQRAWVYPLAGGTGSVWTLATLGGSGTARIPGAPLLAVLQAALDLLRPVSVDEALVLAPSTAATGMVIKLNVTPSKAAYAFDWVESGTLVVDTWTPATLALACTTTVPASLEAAINAGLRPRLQVMSAGLVGVQPECRVAVGGLDGTKKILTLESIPAGWTAPSGAAAETIYSGGPVVAPVAAALLAYIDGLGPSRASGYADEGDVWEDTCAVARLISEACSTLDASGARYVSNVTSALIDGSATDKRGAAWLTGAPELLYAKRIEVVQ